MNISPCPFCNQKNNKTIHPYVKEHADLYMVECENCGGCSPYGASPERAIIRWNEVSDVYYAGMSLKSENNAYRALSSGESPADYAIWSAKRESGRLLGIMKSLLAYARDGETDWSMLYKRIESYIETMESQ